MAATIDIEIRSQATGDLQRVVRDLESLDANAQRAGNGFTVLGGAIASALGNLAANAIQGLAAGLAGLVQSSVDVAAGFEQQMSGVAALLRPTTEQMQALRDAALEMGSTTAFSASEAASGIEMLARNGLNATQILGGALEGTLALAAATGTDLANAANIATDAMAIFGIEAGDMSRAVDLITGVTTNSKFSIDDYRLALAQGGGVAASFSMTMEDFNASIAAVAPLFSSGSDAGTSFKTFLQRLTPDTKEAKEMMRDLGLMTEDGKNKFFDAQGALRPMHEVVQLLTEATADLTVEQRAQALETLFQSDASRLALGLIRAGPDAFRELAAAIQETSAADQAATRMNNFRGAVEELSGAFETFQITLGSFILPVLTNLAQRATGLVNVATTMLQAVMGNRDAFAALAPPLQSIVAGVQGLVPYLQTFASWAMQIGQMLAANWQPVLAVIGGIIAAVVVPALASFIAAAAPVIAVIGAIVAVTALLVNAWQNNFGGIRDATMAVMTQIQNVIQSALGVILGFWQENGSSIMAFVQMAWNAISEIIGTVLGTIFTVISSVLGGVASFIRSNGSTIQGIFTSVWTIISSIVTMYINIIRAIITTVSNAILWVVRNHGSTIQSVFQAVWTAISTIIQFALSVIQGIVTTVTGVINAIVSGNGRELQTIVQTAWAAIQSIVQSALSAVQGFIASAGSAVQGVWNAAMSGLRSITDAAAGAIRGAWDGAMSAVRSIVDGAAGAIRGAWDGAMNTVRSATEGATGAARSAWDSARNAIESAVNRLRGAVENAFNGIRSFLGGINLGDAASAIGRSIIDGIINGIRAGAEAIASAARQAAQAALEAARRALGIRSPSLAFQLIGLSATEGLAEGLHAGAPLAVQAAADAARASIVGAQQVYHQQRTVQYTANFYNIGSSGVSDAIARSLANV